MTEYLKVKADNGAIDLYIKLVPVSGGYRINIKKVGDTFDFDTVENPADGDKIWDADVVNLPAPVTIEHMDGNGDIPVRSSIH